MRPITITERHRQAVMLVAEHGLLDTTQVSVLSGVSRPTAHRLLAALHTAGLLDRPLSGRGRQHRWDYTVTEVGATVAVAGFHSQGRPVPRSVSTHAGRHLPYPERVRQHHINQMLVALTGYAQRNPGEAVLHHWWHRSDARLWLREHGAPNPICDGRGIWIEHGHTVRFTLYWLAGLVVDPPRSAETILADYPGTALVDVVLAVVADHSAEAEMLQRTATHCVPPVIATSTPHRLATDGPCAAVWATEQAALRRRLVDLRPI